MIINHIYDEIGNLIKDVEEGTLIEWTPYGKIRTVTKAADNLTSTIGMMQTAIEYLKWWIRMENSPLTAIFVMQAEM
jgi:hypothetical protein